jgi:hypothetical protein
MDPQKTEESMDDKNDIRSSGAPNPGSSEDSCSCPLTREVVRGVEIWPRLLLIPPEALLTALRTILTSERRAVILCACLAPEPSTGVRFCALDAAGRITIVLPETCAGTASQKPSGNGSYTYETKGNVTELPPEENDTSSIILKK